MSMILNHNVASLMAQRIMHENDLQMRRSVQKLASGLKTKIADLDNTSGLAISEVMRSRIDGMYKALNNSQDGISMVQTAAGALEQTQSILQRMRELSVQSANDTLTQQDRSYIQTEIDELRNEIDRIGNTTQFNKKKLLNGDNAVIWSSSNENVKAIVKGGLLKTDQFGQKQVSEGNYKIQITSTPGKAEIQKSDVFTIKHTNVLANKNLNSTAGIEDLSAKNIPAGSYNVSITGSVESSSETSSVTGVYGIERNLSQSSLIGNNSRSTDNADIMDLAISQDEIDAAGLDNNVIRISDGSNILAEHTIQAGDTTRSIQEDLMAQLNSEKAQAIAGQNGYKLDAYWNTDENLDDAGDSTGIFRAVAYRTDNQTVKTLSIHGGDFAQEKADLATGSFDSEIQNFTSVIGEDGSMNLEIVSSENLRGNASILFEVTDVNTKAGTVTLKATANILTTEGVNRLASDENIVVSASDTPITTSILGWQDPDDPSTGGAISLSLNGSDMAKLYSKGDKFVYNVVAGDDTTPASGDENSSVDQTIVIDGVLNSDWDNSWGGSSTDNSIKYAVEAGKLNNKDIHFKNFYLNSETGEAVEGDVTISFDNNKWGATDDKEILQNPINIASFDTSYVGQVANGNVQLRDIDKMWDAQGNFLLEDPKTITFVQGDGKKASVTIFANDTLDEVADKFNNAIANGLGQAAYVDDGTHFVDFIGASATQHIGDATTESVAGTFVFHSAVPGAAGKISISSASEELLNAFSLNTIQDATETKYNVNIYDAHTDNLIAKDLKITGNRINGVIDDNVDIYFDAMSGVSSTWDDTRKTYIYNNSAVTESVLHLADNTTVLQVGADQGEDMAIHIGDMRSMALGLDAVNVMSRKTAATSISVIDRAIDQVSHQMAKLGSAQSRLEHHVLNLTNEAESLTEANSRIRDTDMAKEIMEYTKMQILSQTNASMIAQANQVQQQILYLFR